MFEHKCGQSECKEI